MTTTWGKPWTDDELAAAQDRMRKARAGSASASKPAAAPAKPKGKPRQLEAAEGRALIEWWDGSPRKGVPPACVRWDLVPDDLVHMPLGGARDARAGALLKAEGARAGYPDYLLDVPAGGFHGLRIELKHPEGSPPTPAQLVQLQRLQTRGYSVAIAYGWPQAVTMIELYLSQKPQRP